MDDFELAMQELLAEAKEHGDPVPPGSVVENALLAVQCLVQAGVRPTIGLTAQGGIEVVSRPHPDARESLVFYPGGKVRSILLGKDSRVVRSSLLPTSRQVWRSP